MNCVHMEYANVYVVGKSIPVKIAVSSNTTVEDITIEVCKLLKIGPVARYLFALRIKSTKIWLSLCLKSTLLKQDDLEFRIRYNVPDINRLKNTDINAYNLYFSQVKYGILHNKIPDINYESHKSEIIGLCVADMYRATIEDGLSKDEVSKDYRRFIPNEVLRKHVFFIKKPVVRALHKIKINNKSDVSFVKSSYLEQFKKLVPNYLTEDFTALVNEGDGISSALIRIHPFHHEFPGIRMKFDGKEEWIHVCAIDELCYLNIRDDGTVEISRKNGIPLYLKFHSLPVMMSFVTLLDGYYRLMVKWIFNLCKDLPCPSLQRLLALKCHGPISGEFSYRKLEEKKSNRPGCFILRQSDLSYDAYYLDVCVKNSSKPVTYKIEITQNNSYTINNGDTVSYPSIQQLINDYKSHRNDMVLKECLPPSEFDQSNLLLCQIDNNNNYGNSCTTLVDQESALSAPICIDTRTLMVFKNMPRGGRCPLTTVYRSVWCKNKTTKINVAIKVLNEKDQHKHLMEFLSLTSRWAFVASNSTVKMFGVTLANPISMVMEYLPLGQLDVYLQNEQNRASIKQVDLVEASTYLANALWYLEEAGFVHGNIRCRKLLVAVHTDNSFIVKLTDPGLYNTYTDSDIHWIPPENYGDLSKARLSSAADVWAFGTTLWEIFNNGKSPPGTEAHAIKKFYLRRKHLPKPDNCPNGVFQLMLECWAFDPCNRKKQQAAMRDINQILYQVYNLRQGHTYSAIVPCSDRHQPDSSSTKSVSDDLNASLFSELTLNTFLDDNEDQNNQDFLNDSGILHEEDILRDPSISSEMYRCITDKNEMMAIVSQDDNDASGTISSMQSIFELDKEWNLILTGRIGEGFYGEVYRGRLVHMYEEREQQLVAVKKMKAHAVTTTSQSDFDREIAIMLKLEHPNVVQIKGVVQDPELCLVLEYVEHGSLQCYLKIHKDRLSPHHLLKFALDVAKGMTYLVDKKVVHRDLAARNILVVNEFSVKISDFGLARFIGNNNYYIFKTERDLPIKWYAPESIEYGKFSHRSDVWSYGVTLFEMFSFSEDPCLPIAEQTQQSICTALKKGVRLPCPKTCPQYVYANLISPCWKYATSQRPTFLQLTSVIEQIFSPQIDMKYENPS